MQRSLARRVGRRREPNKDRNAYGSRRQASRSQGSRCSNREHQFCRDMGNSTNFTRDGVLKQNVRHLCRLAATPDECRPGRDNPYYRGLGRVDFSEGRRLRCNQQVRLGAGRVHRADPRSGAGDGAVWDQQIAGFQALQRS